MALAFSFGVEHSFRRYEYRCPVGHSGLIHAVRWFFEADKGVQDMGSEQALPEDGEPFPLEEFRCEECGGEVELGMPIEIESPTDESLD